MPRTPSKAQLNGPALDFKGAPRQQLLFSRVYSTREAAQELLHILASDNCSGLRQGPVVPFLLQRVARFICARFG